jgi:hypothetical protein
MRLRILLLPRCYMVLKVLIVIAFMQDPTPISGEPGQTSIISVRHQ